MLILFVHDAHCCIKALRRFIQYLQENAVLQVVFLAVMTWLCRVQFHGTLCLFAPECKIHKQILHILL